jgi:hypothetical protein
MTIGSARTYRADVRLAILALSARAQEWMNGIQAKHPYRIGGSRFVWR